MAIKINLDNQEACARAYLNYYCQGNTAGISPDVMGAIVNRWSHKIEQWVANASKDSVNYEVDDIEYNKAYSETQNSTGGDTAHWDNALRSGSNAANSVAAGAAGTKIGVGVIAEKGVEKAVEKFAEEGAQEGLSKLATAGLSKASKQAMEETAKKAAEEASTKALEEATKKALEETGNELAEDAAQEVAKNAAKNAAKDATKETTKKVAQNISSYIAITMGAITAAQYFIKRPNKDNHEACLNLMNEMGNAQAQLSESQGNMATTKEEIIQASNEAQEANDLAAANIEDTKTDYDMYNRIYQNLSSKITAGGELSEEEKKLYNNALANLSSTSEIINDEAETASEINNEKTGEISSLEGTYDDVVDTISNVQGTTDFAADVDEATRTLCFVEAGSQGLNALSTGKAALRLMGTSGIAWWNIAVAAAGFAAAASSGFAAAEQVKWADDAGTEIAARKTTEDINTNTTGLYETERTTFDYTLDNIKENEIVIPDEIEAPENAPAVPTSKTNNKPANTNTNTNTNTGDKKKPEENK